MKAKKGFTLIELLIVIAIIGILSAALLPTILNAPARGRDTAREANLNTIVTALEAFNADYGKYPSVDGCIGGTANTAGAIFVDDDDVDVSGVYFPGGVLADPTGTRTLPAGVTQACVAGGGYVYNASGGAIANVQYVLGTVMELTQNNNTDSDLTLGVKPTLGGTKLFALIK